ncbi:MAG: adenylyltransferase/cytidyltransferase family protein [Myxococcales bacterium]|nr:adenylyltransferase/cytidyltransferase family protein [Myxococcales bacterium]
MALTVVTFGTFDLFHYGHLRLLERARVLGTRLEVGISSDALNLAKKGRPPVIPLAHRMRIVGALDVVDAVFVEESLELKGRYLEERGADLLVMGDDWRGHFDRFADICDVCYLPRTEGISTTHLRHVLGHHGGASATI